MIAAAATFALVCAVTAFVCASLKEDEDRHLWLASLRLFGVMACGIAAFAGVVQVLTHLAS